MLRLPQNYEFEMKSDVHQEVVKGKGSSLAFVLVFPDFECQLSYRSLEISLPGVKPVANSLSNTVTIALSTTFFKFCNRAPCAQHVHFVDQATLSDSAA